MSLSFTLGIYNSFLLPEFLEEIIQLNLLDKMEYFNFEHIEVPEWQSLQVLPLEMKKIVAQKYRDLLPKFRNFTTQLDLLRSESFHTLFEQESILLGPWPQKT